MANSASLRYTVNEDPIFKGKVKGYAVDLSTTGTDLVVYTPDTDKSVYVKGLVGAETNATNLSFKQRSPALTGTAATTNTSAVITGTGTTWTTDFSVASGFIASKTEVVVGTTTFIILSVDSDTQITATAAATATVSAQTVTRQDILVVPEYAANQGIYSKVMKNTWDLATAAGYSLVMNSSGALSSLLVHVQEGKP